VALFKRRSSGRAWSGIASIKELRDSDLVDVPRTPGVYLVLRPRGRLHLLPKNPAGRHKDRDPTLPVGELRARLADRALILYIGKASGSSRRSTLRARLKALFRQGEGHRAGHWGGRALWQLGNSRALRVCWRTTSERGARRLERIQLSMHRRAYGQYPFANRTG